MAMSLEAHLYLGEQYPADSSLHNLPPYCREIFRTTRPFNTIRQRLTNPRLYFKGIHGLTTLERILHPSNSDSSFYK